MNQAPNMNAPQQPYVPAPQNPNKGKAIAGMVLGICGLVIPYGGLLCAILGLIFSIIALKGYQKGEPGRGMAVAGLVCSIVGLAGSVIILISCIGCAAAVNEAVKGSGVTASDWEDLARELEKAAESLN